MMGQDKIQTRDMLAPMVRAQQEQGKRVVFTNGCFDIIHKGHILYLREAKAQGDVLVVALNDDSSVRRLKGETRPINTLTDRMIVMSALESVDYVTHFSEDTPIETLRILRPDVHVKGGDYQPKDLPEANVVAAYGGTVVVVSFYEGYSTTNTLTHIR